MLKDKFIDFLRGLIKEPIEVPDDEIDFLWWFVGEIPTATLKIREKAIKEFQAKHEKELRKNENHGLDYEIKDLLKKFKDKIDSREQQ